MRLFLPLFVLAAALCVPGLAVADDPPPSPAAEPGDDKYSQEELLEIVGPIALYPDIVISSLLPASNFPTDVVMAARFVKKSPGPYEEMPEEAEGWDPSVGAMLQFPDVLEWMNDNLDWLEQLGWAVAVQQEDVLDAIQDFRNQAKEAGNLESNEYLNISEEPVPEAPDDEATADATATNETVIVIQPTDPQVVYVPTYQPAVVTQPYTGTGSAWNFGVGFAAGAFTAWAVHGIRWGGHGHGGSINVNRNVNVNRPGYGGGGRWNAPSRPGTRPGNRPPRGRGGAVSRPGKPGYGGRPGQKPVKRNTGVKRPANRPGGGAGNRPGNSRPGGDRPGGNRPGGTRPSSPAPGAGNRPGSRPGSGAGNRPGSGAGNRPGSGSGNRPSGNTGKRPSSGSRPSSSGSRKKSSGSAFGGSSRSGSNTRKSSSRGRSSTSRSSGSRGGSRGGGGRGGGGRRR